MHKRRNFIFYLSIIFLVMLGVAAAAAPLIAPYNPTTQNLEQRFKAPRLPETVAGGESMEYSGPGRSS